MTNKNQLEALGIDISELQDEIINRAASLVANRVLEKERGEKKLYTLAEGIIRGELENAGRDLMERKITPVNMWGEATDEETTFRDRFLKLSEDFWMGHVDSRGEPVDKRYGTTRRYIFVARQIVEEVVQAELKKEIDKIIAEAKGKVKEGVSQAIADILKRRW